VDVLKTIVVPVDGSEFSERALPYAANLAKATGARLVLVRAAERPLSLEAVVDPTEATFDSFGEAEADLAATMARLGNDPAIEPRVYTGDAAQAIIDAARLNEASLIVMATHGRSGLGRWLYGSVADHVIRGSRVPVLLVPITCEASWPADQTRRILVALDGSALAEEGLDQIAPFAAALQAELTLVRVVADGEAAHRGVSAAQAYLTGLSKRLQQQGARVGVLALEGDPPQKIASLAREMDAHIIAVTTHGRGGVARYVLGSVAAEILHRATKPLLVFRPAGVSRHAPAPAADMTFASEAPVLLTVTAGEVRLLTEAVALLLSSAEKEEHLAKLLHNLQTKLASATAAATLAGVQ